MSIKFGRINYSETTFGENTFHKNQNLTSASSGISLIHFRRDDRKVVGTDDSPLSVSGSHWAFIHNHFYRSGSNVINKGSNLVSHTAGVEYEKFNSFFHSYNQHSDLKPFHKNKFYTSGSVIYVPQQYFGQRIKPGTFQLTARTGSATSTTKQIIIKDDSNGNLFSSNSHFSQSSSTSISSSQNYIGNIFYDLGVVTLTETASWSGSVNYTDIGGKAGTESNYKFWSLDFNSTTPVFTSQYSIKIPSSAFNVSINPTVRVPISGSIPSGSNLSDFSNLRNDLTGSGWSPYFNQVLLYRDKTGEEPILMANLPRAVQKREDIDLIITFRVDH